MSDNESPKKLETPRSRDSWFPPALAFHFSLTAAFAAIGVLWIITPLAYGYVLYNLVTLAPALQYAAPKFRVVNAILLTYCSIEIAFSLYYRYLIRRSQALRPPPVYSRKFLRQLFAKSLENGMDTEEGIEQELLSPVSPDTGKGKQLPLVGQKEGSDSEDTLGNTDDDEFPPKAPLPAHCLDFQSHIRLWFHDVPFASIYAGDMTDWLSWSLYSVPYSTLLAERHAWEAAGRPKTHIEGILDDDESGLEIVGDKLGLVEHCVELVERRAGVRFREGRNEKIKVIRLTLDKVKVASRPFILYAFVWLAQRLVINISKSNSFTEERIGNTRFLLRVPTGWVPERDAPESKKPLLFIHGLGMGVAQYWTLVAFLCRTPKLQARPIIIFIQPHISMSFFSSSYLSPPDQKSCTTDFAIISKKYGFDTSGLTVFSHSNGTMVHGWLLKAMPEMFMRNCFVDPVCFCLWEPFVAFGFLYSTPRTPIEYLMRYFVSRELGIALMLQRHFDWSSNLLFPTSIPNFTSPYHSAVFVSGQDSILNAPRIRRYLRQAGMKEVKKGENVGQRRGGMKTHMKNKHGQSMIGSGRAFAQIMAWVTADSAELQLSSLESSESDTQVELEEDSE